MASPETDQGSLGPERETTKTIDLEIEVEADSAAVWEALSQGQLLRRWFPLDARIEPGVGGTVWLSWGPGVEATGEIEVWEEGRHLRYVDQVPEDHQGVAEEQRVRVAVDYFLEARGGTTVVRLVNSGFEASDDWADFVDTVDSGWRYCLWNLKHYLERHRGKERRMVWERRWLDVPKEEAWRRLLGSGGLAETVSPVEIGAEAHGTPVTLWSGDQGVVHRANAPIHLAARFESLGDALLLLELEPGDGRYHMGVWLSLYGVEEEQGRRLECSLASALDRLLPLA